MKFDITAKHPEYTRRIAEWQFMADANDGETAIKDKGETYLPMKSGIKAMSDANRRTAAYDRYKFRAEFPEILGPTIRGSSGLIHKTPSVIELPSALEGLFENATQSGLTLAQLHTKITTEIMLKGRYCLMPGVDDGELFLAPYTAETVINWDQLDGTPVYTVFDESSQVRNPETNKWERLEAYRECAVEEGRFVSRVWMKDSKGEFVPGEDEDASLPTRQGLDFLPVSFIGSQDLTPKPDDIPMIGLARLARRAYVLDADYTNTLHMTSEPTPWVSGVDKKDAPKTIGAATLWVLASPDASAGMLEFSGQGVDAQEVAISNTLRRAMMFGAQLFADTSRAAESGDAIETRLGHQTSPLKMIAEASAAGLEDALRNCAVWAGANPDEVSVEPNLEFFERQLGPQEIKTLVEGWMGGAYSKMTLFQNLQRGGIIDEDKTFEDEQEEIEGENPLLGGVDGDGI